MEDALFATAIALLLTHEMDAVRHREWRILPGLSRIRDDDTAYVWFTAVHVPLYVALLLALFAGDAPNATAARWLDGFLVVHAGLHLALYRLPENRFRGAFSYALILGAGLCGGAHLVAITV